MARGVPAPITRLLQLLSAALVIGAGVSHASFFSRQADGQQVAEFRGTIASVDAVSLRIRPDEGSVMTFVVDDSSALPTGLVAGTRVSVRYETREGGGRRLLTVSLAEGASAPPQENATPDSPATPAAPDSNAALALEAPAHGAAAALATDLVAPQPHEASSTPTTAPTSGGPCPLQLVAVGLLVATGALLVIASWR